MAITLPEERYLDQAYAMDRADAEGLKAALLLRFPLTVNEVLENTYEQVRDKLRTTLNARAAAVEDKT